MIYIRFTITSLFFLFLSPAQGRGSPDIYKDLTISENTYAIIIKKSKFRLEIIDHHKKLIAVFPVGIGKNPDLGPKLHEGDFRTPEGLYYIKEILSEDAPEKSQSYIQMKKLNSSFLKAENGNHYRKDNTKSLGFYAYGPRFLAIDYPNAEDLEKYEEAKKKGEIPIQKNGKPAGPGFGIGIHGNIDLDAIGYPASSGCVTLKNEDVVKLDAFIKKGTPVLILH